MADKILVTGGCGFIGSTIVQKLVNDGYHPIVLDDFSTGKKENINSCLKKVKCSLIEGSITNLKLLEKIMEKIDVVIHEAAKPDVKASKENLFRDFETNVTGTLKILQAMVQSKTSKIIFASSGGTVYGETEKIPTSESEPFAPISHYGASKAACEQYLSSFSSLHDIEAISLRLGNIYGPPSDHGVMFDFYHKLKKNPLEMEILGDGNQIKSYLYVDDCVDAHMKALNKTLKRHTALNIASIEGTTVNEIANEVVTAMNLSNVDFTYTGGKRGWAGDVRKAVVDISKAKDLLSWKPKTSLMDGVKNYISWLESKNK